MAEANRFQEAITSNKTQRVIKLMVLGAVGFWLPDTVWHAVKGMRFDGADVLAITLLMPLTLLGIYILVRRSQRNESRQSVGWPLMAGVWLLGGLFITIGATFSGGGFVGSESLRGAVIVLLLSILPPYLFIMATYDGSLAALLVVSIISGVVWLVGHGRKTPLQRPNS